MMSITENDQACISYYFCQFMQLTDTDVNHKDPGKWCKKEILGHLCDSAINNIYRFMQLQKTDLFEVVKYDQVEWVAQAAYHSRSWIEICTLWQTLNSTILYIKAHISSAPSRSVLIDGAVRPVAWLLEDYFIHLHYHAQQIISNGKA